MGQIINVKDFLVIRSNLKLNGKKLVFTNGCFDILHKGHIEYLNEAKKLGDVLFVGLNSDISVREIKGNKRPLVPQDERALILANLIAVDYVSFFDEPTPINIISKILPDFLVKGADWDLEKVVGKDIVESNGGKVLSIKLTPNKSTTNIINKIVDLYSS